MIGIALTYKNGGHGKIQSTSIEKHDAKAIAGKEFYHCGNIKSVCVYDGDGQVHLYLKKGMDGKVIMRQESVQ